MSATNFYRWDGADLKLRVKVSPRARQNAVMGANGDALYVRITAPPVENKANQVLIELLAKLFKVPKRQVEITYGLSNAHKQVTIHRPENLPESL